MVDTKHDTDSASSNDEEGREPAQAPAGVIRSDAEHSATFWIHKYMQQVCSWDYVCLHGGMMMLCALSTVVADHWLARCWISRKQTCLAPDSKHCHVALALCSDLDRGYTFKLQGLSPGLLSRGAH